MNAALIFELINKGLTVIRAVADNGDLVRTAVNAVQDITAKPMEQVTEEDISKTEVRLDALLDEFNAELPDA